jgi:uncharacterized protein YbjT (DUF2867 family)
MTTILVTGATGTVGSEIVRRLAGRPGVRVLAATRTTSAPAEGVEAVAFDYTNADTMAAALRGVDRLFLLAPNLPDQVGASTRLVELAAVARVKHVVKLSALGCDEEPTIAFGRAHRDVERRIMASGLGFTFLRPNNFMNNFLGLRHDLFAPNGRGEIRLPWGEAACSFVAAADIAAVAAAALTEEGHEGKTYDLTGPEALRLAEVAEIIAAASGRPIRYVDLSPEEMRRELSAGRMPPPLVEAVLELHALGKAGRAAAVTSTIAEVIGRPATTFRAFAAAHATTWKEKTS